MDQPGEQSHGEHRQTEIMPDGLTATIGQPNPKTETIQNLPTSRHQSGVVAEYWVQVAAMRNETEARRLWAPSEKDFGMVVTAMEPHFERSETPDGIIYKVQFGPFQARHEAQDLCTWLTDRKATCFVISH
jgi:cell division septation protein DedD